MHRLVRPKLRFAAAPMLGLLGLLGGCVRPGGPTMLWVVSPGLTAAHANVPPAFESPLGESTRRVVLAGAANETLSFRLGLRAEGAAVPRPVLRAESLRCGGGVVASDGIRIFRMHPVPAGPPPGWHIRSIPPQQRVPAPLDVLVPLGAPIGGLPESLPAGVIYALWVDVDLPRDAPPGRCVSRIHLLSDGAEAASVDLELTVWPLVLPDPENLRAVIEVDHRAVIRHHVRQRGRPLSLTVDDWRDHPQRAAIDETLFATLSMLRRHRLTPVLHRLGPAIRLDARGTLEIDWAAYDETVGPLLGGRAFSDDTGMPLWPMPPTDLFRSLRSHPRLTGPTYEQIIEEYLEQCARHFRSRGWMDRAYAVAGGPDGRDTPTLASVEAFAALAREADPAIAVASPRWPQDMRPYGWPESDAATDGDDDAGGDGLGDGVDIWMPPAQFFDVEAMARQGAAGKRIWLAVDRPPFSGTVSIHAPASYVRVLSWQAASLGAETLYLRSTRRPDEPDRANAKALESGVSLPLSAGSSATTAGPTAAACVAADPNALFYPGGPFGLSQPVPSVRLKTLSRSLQDAAYLALLRQQGLDYVADALVRSVAPYAGSDAYRTSFADGRPVGWAADETVFDLARDIMARELILASAGGGSGGGPETLRRSSAWRRLMLATRRLHVRCDGVRIRRTGSPSQWRARAECALSIENRTRGPVSGTIGAVDPAAGWRATKEPTRVSTIAPNGRRRATVILEAEGPVAAPAGVVSVPIEFNASDGSATRLDARVALVTAIPLSSPIRIDGDLGDWPPGSVNVAADFRSIAGNRAAGSVTDQPRRGTTVFFAHDKHDLYVAVNCESDRTGIKRESRRNRVTYDDLIPVGEELVELLFDPLNAGTRSPGDLFRLVIKPSGAYLAEEGLATDPPCGLRAPWPADPEIATAQANDRWTAELRIPLATFETGAVQDVVWGMNITRFDRRHDEFSTWSGATGNAYDPLSLGNLYFP
ncbi:MAG: hypothetical protein ACE5EX_06870 [Phycisphaerae bacterium]